MAPLAENDMEKEAVIAFGLVDQKCDNGRWPQRQAKMDMEKEAGIAFNMLDQIFPRKGRPQKQARGAMNFCPQYSPQEPHQEAPGKKKGAIDAKEAAKIQRGPLFVEIRPRFGACRA